MGKPNCFVLIDHGMKVCGVCMFCSLLCSKKLFSTVHNFVHLNLAIALFMGYMIFAVGVELAKDNEVKVWLHLYDSS